MSGSTCGPRTYDEEAQEQQALVTFHEIVGRAKKARMIAVAGEVAITAAPADHAALKTGARIKGKIDVSFPSRQLQQLDCGGGGAVGETLQTECRCRDAEGQISTCVPASPKDNCCVDAKSTPVRRGFTFDAVLCAWMCYWIADRPELGKHCPRS